MAEQWRILVVDGEENLNRNIVNALQKDGYFVRGVANGAEAIRLLWSEDCDVLICNQQIPDTDGFDLLQWVRTYCPNTRMIMLGIPGSGITRTQALEMGVASYLEQPLEMRALKEELRRLLHQTGFSASLDSFDLLDVIQIITMSRKSIVLVVSIGVEEEGVLRFQNGELVWAEYGMLRGEEAFFALAAHKNGMVVHRPWDDEITPNVTQPLSRLIFQALQYRSKYADYQQLSNELEPVQPASQVPDPPTLPPSLPTTPPEALQDLEEDDRPFQFVAENAPAERAPASTVFEQLIHGSYNSPLEQVGGMMGVMKNTEQEATPGSKAQKEWWEPTGSFPAIQRSGNMQAVTDEALVQTQRAGINAASPAGSNTAAAQNHSLPSWLTEQPTNLGLPVLRGNTGQMPAAPKEHARAQNQSEQELPSAGAAASVVPPPSPALSSLPAISAVPPVQPGQNVRGDWSTSPGTAGFNPTESGLRKIKPDEALQTGSQRAIKPGESVHPTPAEWQLPGPPLAGSQTGQMNSVKTSRTPLPGQETLQSLAALRKTGSSPEARQADVSAIPTPIPEVQPASKSTSSVPAKPAKESEPAREAGPRGGTQPMRAVEKTARRNYPALAAALQTLGYSLPGFIASAVVSLDGTPIAQVAVDEMDISPMCVHFCTVIQGVLQALEQGREDVCEYTMITSPAQHILLRMIGNKRDVFQVLLTTRETNPRESLEVMANVEAAIAAALP